MAATALTVANGAAFGNGVADINPQAVDDVDDNVLPNDGRTVVWVSNGSGGALTVTIKVPASPRSANEAIDKTVTVANTKQAMIGPFPTSIYGASVTLGWSTDTSVTAAPVRLARTDV